MSVFPSVSYIIPVFNKAEFLPYTLASLAAQRGDFSREYIFIDDGSTDDSAKIIHETTQSWENVYYIYQDNSGPARATNRGIDAAQGQWIKLLDGDDVLLPEATKALLYTQQHAKIPLVFSPFTHWTTEKDLTDLWSTHPKSLSFKHSSADPLQEVISSMPVSTASGMLASRELLLQSQGCDERVFVQDYSLMLRLSLLSSWVTLEVPFVVCPAFHRGGVTRLSQAGYQERHDLNAALYWFFKDHPELDLAYVRQAAIKATGRARKVADKKWRHTFNWLKAHRKSLSRKEYLELIKKSLDAFDPMTLRISAS